jgi:hypothetical protein
MASPQHIVAAFLMLPVCAACGDSGSGGAGPGPGGAGLETGGAAASVGMGGDRAVGGAAGMSSGLSGAAGAGSGLAGQPSAGGAGGTSTSELSARLARYHRSDTDRALRFELDAVSGLEPYPSSLAYLEAFVGRSVDKPEGVSFHADESLQAVGSDHVWTFDELDAFSRAHASDDGDGPVSIHVLFIDGAYDSGEGGGTVLGLAWGQRYIAMFQDALRSGCSGALVGALSPDLCELAERSVWGHEIGHVIGLVDNGLVQQTPHRDAEHGRHDVSDGCLMYWAYEEPEVFDVLLSRLGGGQSGDIDFCDNCWADLRAARQ